MTGGGPVLITGALGFVGRWLVGDLLASGVQVFGLDLVPAGTEPPAGPAPFRLAGPNPELPEAWTYEAPAGSWTLIPCSLVDAVALSGWIQRLQPGAVYHLAAQSSAAHSFQDPEGTFATNVGGALNLLEGIRALPPATRPILLAFGSAEECGRPVGQPTPFTEESPLQPISPYGVSKCSQTLLCQQYFRSFDLPIIATRSFSHTGPGHDPRFAFPSFAGQIAQAERGEREPRLSVGNLTPVRDYLDVRDVIRAYQLLVASGEPGEVYNVCSGESLTMQGLDILLEGARCPIEVHPDPERQRPADLTYLVGSCAKLHQRTGWRPERDLRATLNELLAWARGEDS